MGCFPVGRDSLCPVTIEQLIFFLINLRLLPAVLRPASRCPRPFPSRPHNCSQFPRPFSRYLKVPVAPACCQIIYYATPGIELQPQVQFVYPVCFFDLMPVAGTLTFPCTFCPFRLWMLCSPASLLARKPRPFSLLNLLQCTCLSASLHLGLARLSSANQP